MDLTFGGKIKEARKAKHLTQKQLAEKIGAKHNSVSDWENNKNKPDPDTIELLCGVLDITPNYLLSLETVEFSPTEKLLIKKYRSLDPHGQDMVDTVLNKECERVSKYGKLTAPATIIEYQPKQESKIIALPYFRAGVSAGSGIFILGNEAEDEIELPDLPEYEAADFAIDVNGDSMEPDFSHEDIALVQRDAEMRIGDIGVFIVNGEAFIKELGKNQLISRNKKYKNIPIHEGDNVVCMGKVIGKVMY